MATKATGAAKPIISGTIATGESSAAFQMPLNGNLFKITLIVVGTFASTTVKLQGSLDGSTWFDITSGSLTASGCVTVEHKVPYLRVTATGGTGTGLSYSVS